MSQITISGKLDSTTLSKVKELVPHFFDNFLGNLSESDRQVRMNRVYNEYDTYNDDLSAQWIVITHGDQIVATLLKITTDHGIRLAHLMAPEKTFMNEMIEYVKENVNDFYTFIHKTNKLKDLYLSHGLTEVTEFEAESGRDPKDGWVKLVKTK